MDWELRVIHTPYSMVKHIIRADILRVALYLFNTSDEQNVSSYYMLNHWIRGLLFHYKKMFFAIGFYFLVRVFRIILIRSVRMMLIMSKLMVIMSKIFARFICQTIEWEVNYSTANKCYFGFYFLLYFGPLVRPVQP